MGLVLQQPVVSTVRMQTASDVLCGTSDVIFSSTYDDRPSKLCYFDPRRELPVFAKIGSEIEKTLLDRLIRQPSVLGSLDFVSADRTPPLFLVARSLISIINYDIKYRMGRDADGEDAV